jgi:PAS domain S-box-containing protein
MNKLLRVLIVEDSEDDALLVERELKQGGYEVSFKRVETEEAMDAALSKEKWDIIISDYVLPHFSGLEALGLVKRKGIDLPFIITSGKIGEEAGIETIKAGAHDYLMKNNLKRLASAVERAMCDAESRREFKKAEEAIKRSNEEWEETFNSMTDSIFVLDKDFNIIKANKASIEILKMNYKDIIGRKCYELVHDLDHPWPGCPFEKVIQDHTSHRAEVNDSHIGIPLDIAVSPIFEANGELRGAVHIATDIANRKKIAEEKRNHLQELEIYYKTTMGREKRIIELKEEMEKLKEELKKYKNG